VSSTRTPSLALATTRANRANASAVTPPAITLHACARCRRTRCTVQGHCPSDRGRVKQGQLPVDRRTYMTETHISIQGEVYWRASPSGSYQMAGRTMTRHACGMGNGARSSMASSTWHSHWLGGRHVLRSRLHAMDRWSPRDARGPRAPWRRLIRICSADQHKGRPRHLSVVIVFRVVDPPRCSVVDELRASCERCARSDIHIPARIGLHLAGAGSSTHQQ